MGDSILIRQGMGRAGVVRAMGSTLSAAAVALSSLCGCKQDATKQMKMPERPPARVTTAAVYSQDVPVYLDEIGRTLAIDSVSIVPQIGGKITAVAFEDGAFVSKGDLLFEIDPRPFEAALASANAALEENRALLSLARGELERYGAAVAAAAVSKLEFDQKKNAVAVTEAKVSANQAAVDSAKLDLEYSKIYAPIDGRAGARLVDPGNVVKANDRPLLVIQRLNPIYAEFTITENDLGTLRKYLGNASSDLTREAGPRLRVEVTIPSGLPHATATVAASTTQTTQPEHAANTPRSGELTFLDNAVANQSGTVRLRATMPNADGYFWPGQFVQVRLILETLRDAVLIPAEAQQISQQGPYVYVVQPDGTAELRPIVPGQRQGEAMVVREGLRVGEQVIVSGHMAVIPREKVEVVNGTFHSPSPAAAKQDTVASGK